MDGRIHVGTAMLSGMDAKCCVVPAALGYALEALLVLEIVFGGPVNRIFIETVS